MGNKATTDLLTEYNLKSGLSTLTELRSLFGEDFDYYFTLDDLYGEQELAEAIEAEDLEGAKHIIRMMQHHYPPHPDQIKERPTTVN